MGKDRKVKGGLCIAAVAILFLGAGGTLIAWAISSPYEPIMIVEASISGYNLTADNHLTSTFDVHVTAYNPNSHYFIYYDALVVSVYDHGTLLADELFTGPFTNHPKTQLPLKLGLAAHNVLVADGPGSANATIVEDLRAAGRSGGEANLEVQVRAATRFVQKGWKEFAYVTKAVCSPVTVKFNSSSEAEAEASGSQWTRCYVSLDCTTFLCYLQ